jgi:benzodiazapine receptor
MSKPESRSLLTLAGFGLITAGAAWYGARYSRRADRDSWYRRLDKPRFVPPDSAYPAIWTTLFALIAWSGWRVWCAAPSRDRDRALKLWITQLASNAEWSKLFFGEHRPTVALSDALALESQVISYILTARKVDRAAANAFIPYGAWLAYTTLLNAEIVRRNPRAA